MSRRSSKLIFIIVLLVIIIVSAALIARFLGMTDHAENVDRVDNVDNVDDAGNAEDEDNVVNAENADHADMVAEVIAAIENEDGYRVNEYWESIAAVDDFNGDGIQDVVAVYEKGDELAPDVMYAIWSIEKSGIKKIKEEKLYTEVGGNYGVVGIVERDGKRYLAVEQSEPEGDKFSDYYRYYPWGENDGTPQSDGAYYMEASGYYDNEDQGSYILGEEKVDVNEFNEAIGRFSSWKCRLDMIELANSINVKTFEELNK